MMLQNKLGVKTRGRMKNRYNIKRYYCDLCDINQSLFGSGTRDEEMLSQALDEAKAEQEGYKKEKILK